MTFKAFLISELEGQKVAGCTNIGIFIYPETSSFKTFPGTSINTGPGRPVIDSLTALLI